MATHFFKGAFANLLLDSTEFDGADFAATMHYQMVPFRGSRTLQLTISPGAPQGKVRLGMRDAGIFTIGLPASEGTFPPGGTFIELSAAPERTLDLTLTGANPGRTILVVEDMNGIPIDFVSIAVKREVERTYNLHTISDSFNRSPRTMGELKTIAAMAEKVYLKQANVRLRRVKESDLSFHLVSFGDPLHLHDSPRPHLPSNDLNVFETVQAELQSSGFKSQHLNIISTWTQKAPPGTLTRGDTPRSLSERTSYIAGFNPMRTVEEATVFAHEVGHALGLIHDNHNLDQMMGEGRFGSFLMSRTDIDVLNTTDRA